MVVLGEDGVGFSLQPAVIVDILRGKPEFIDRFVVFSVLSGNGSGRPFLMHMERERNQTALERTFEVGPDVYL